MSTLEDVIITDKMRRCTSHSKITAACNMTEINSNANVKGGKRQKKVSEACSKVSGS